MDRDAGRGVDVSICMVSLNCWHVIVDCLESIADGADGVSTEVIVVDNASTDGTPDRLERLYPWVTVIRNDANVGFSRGTNQAIHASRGRYLLWLNTDTILHPGSLRDMVEFLDTHPRAGVVGPCVLNADGTFQPQCRRGLPTPQASLAYMLGLHRWWPDHPIAGQYLLSHLPTGESNPVAAVSGCCLLARREVWDEIGPIDEDIFGFGEDIDWCVRAGKAGWEVWYDAASVITHLKGQGGVHAHPYRKVKGIHQAMWVFYRKHLRPAYNPAVTIAVRAGIGASFVASIAGTWVRRRLRGPRRRHESPRQPAAVAAPARDVA